MEKNDDTESDKRYTYDNSGRLTQIYLAHNSLYRNQEYDVRGRLTSSYISTSSNGGASVSYKYEYDNYGNRVRTRYYYSDDLRYRYTWERGRLLSSVSNGNNVTLGLYAYDINGVRYKKTTSDGTTTYYYNGNTLLGENRSNNRKLRYFYDATGLCGFSYCDGANAAYYVYVKDVLGNIVMLKNETGDVVAKYSYDEWGVCTVENLIGTIGNINPFRYRGYYYDVESKLYYLMSRYYDPEIGQFISMDSVDYLAPDAIGGVDLYAYCGNNPVMFVDSTGNAPWWNCAISGLQVLSGLALCFVPGAQGIGASLIIGGTLGLIYNAVSPVIAQALGGVSSIANGAGAFSTGVSILGLGIPGLIGGIALMLVGTATMAFGANEVMSAATGTNYIQQWTGMSDATYSWTYLGLNLASSIGQIAGRAYNLHNTRNPIYNSKTGELKQYRYFDSKGRKLFDVDLQHPTYGNPQIKFPHFHAWLKNGTRLGIRHTGYFIMILELFRRLFS